MPYADSIDEVVVACAGHSFSSLACETNGVGGMPSQMLSRRLSASSELVPEIFEVVGFSEVWWIEDEIAYLADGPRSGRIDGFSRRGSGARRSESRTSGRGCPRCLTTRCLSFMLYL